MIPSIPKPWRHVFRIVRKTIPTVLTVCLILISTLPFPFPMIGNIMPWWGLMAIVYWAVYRPDLLAPLTALLIGLMQDMLTATPVGVHALMYVAAYWAVISQRRLFLNGSFPVLWWGFGMVTVGAGLLGWVSICFIQNQLLPFWSYIGKILTTTAAFPLLAWFLMLTQRTLLARR